MIEDHAPSLWVWWISYQAVCSKSHPLSLLGAAGVGRFMKTSAHEKEVQLANFGIDPGYIPELGNLVTWDRSWPNSGWAPCLDCASTIRRHAVHQLRTLFSWRRDGVSEEERLLAVQQNIVEFYQTKSPDSATNFQLHRILAIRMLRNIEYDKELCVSYADSFNFESIQRHNTKNTVTTIDCQSRGLEKLYFLQEHYMSRMGIRCGHFGAFLWPVYFFYKPYVLIWRELHLWLFNKNLNSREPVLAGPVMKMKYDEPRDDSRKCIYGESS